MKSIIINIRFLVIFIIWIVGTYLFRTVVLPSLGISEEWYFLLVYIFLFLFGLALMVLFFAPLEWFNKKNRNKERTNEDVRAAIEAASKESEKARADGYGITDNDIKENLEANKRFDEANPEYTKARLARQKESRESEE